MYEVSNAFHTAVKQPAPQVRALLDFGTTFFTNRDIAASTGLYLTEAVNLEENLTIGSCTSGTLTTTIFNANHLLDDFSYGRFKASLGVLIGTQITTAQSSPFMIVGDALVNVGAFLEVNGTMTTSQPSFEGKAMLMDGTDLYVIGEDGAAWHGTFTGADVTGGETVVLNAFMQDKFSDWTKSGRSIYKAENVVQEFFQDGTIENWEYCPLGSFIAEMPMARKVEQVAVSAYDIISLFDEDASAFTESIVYPTTIGDIFTSLCDNYGVEAKSVQFVNADMVLEEAPADFSTVTGRDVLAWIAEAAGGFCRMSRDGKVEIVWFGDVGYDLGKEMLYAVERSEQSVKPIDKLQVSVTDTDIGVIVGEGTNGYQVVDNPFLYGMTDEEVRAKVEPIYKQIARFPEFYPANITALCDPSVQAGDMITVSDTGTPILLPIFVQNIAWVGGTPTVTMEATGDEYLPTMTKKNKQLLQQGRQKHEFEVSIERLRSDVQMLSDQQGEQASTILQDAQQIILSALESYVKTQDYDTFRDTISTTLKILSNQVELNFVTSTQQINAVDGNMQEFINQQLRYIRFIDGNIVLGENGNEFVLQLENDRISFLQNGTEIAYFANYKIHATDGEFESSVAIGNFQWVYLPDGSFGLV